jgi:hypothetical protein
MTCLTPPVPLYGSLLMAIMNETPTAGGREVH